MTEHVNKHCGKRKKSNSWETYQSGYLQESFALYFEHAKIKSIS